MSVFEEMIEKSEEYDSHKADHVVNLKDVTFDQVTAEIRPPGTLFGVIPPLAMTDWALNQMCQKVGTLPYSYAKACPSDLRATNLNAWAVLADEDKRVLLRSYDQTCRAVLSGQYSPVSNTMLLEKMEDVTKDVVFAKVSHYLDADTFHGKFTIGEKPTDGNSFGVGYYIGNGEIGNRSVRVAPYVQRNSCQNSIVFLDWGIEIRHYRVSTAYIWGAIKETIGQAIGKSVEAVNKFVEAEMTAIPNISKVIEDMAERYGLSLPVQKDILRGTEGKETLAAVVNGLSFAARDMENVEARIDMEALAGAILIDPKAMYRKAVQPVGVVASDEYEPAG